MASVTDTPQKQCYTHSYNIFSILCFEYQRIWGLRRVCSREGLAWGTKHEKISSFLSIIIFLIFNLAHAASAQRYYYSIPLSGLLVSCQTSWGQQVPIYLDDAVYRNIGRAGYAGGNPRAPYIVLSPTWLNQVPYQAAMFWFYHECAHVNLPIGIGVGNRGSEITADCFAINRMKAHNLIRNPGDFNAIASSIINLPGSGSGHLPGPYRINAMARC